MALGAFALFAGLILYSYAVYPILLWVLALLFGEESRADEAHTPSVSFLIPAYNEEGVIGSKIENTLALDYPRDRLEVIVASESDDGTDDIVRGYPAAGIRLLSSAVRRGKVANQNRAIPESRGEILVFTDANAMLRPDALRKLVRHFADPRIGSVSGRLTYANPAGSAAGETEGLYWGMEQIIKRASSRLFSLPGANGSLYAVRRSCHRPISEDRGDDFEIPIRCILDGWGSILEPEAVSVEEATAQFVHEYRRKVRIVNWMVASAARLLREAVQRGRLLLAFQIVSHKMNRWAVPFWLVGLLVSNLLLLDRGPLLQATAAAQVVFYASALSLLAWDRRVRPIKGMLAVPSYFVVVNAASAVGITTCLLGRRVAWLKTR